MIVQFIIGCFFLLGSALVNLIPSIQSSNGGIGDLFYKLLQIGMYFFGANTFAIVISNVLLWSGIHFVLAIIEWAYKKVPGVD